MNGKPSRRPSASSVARISSLLRTSTQSPTLRVLRIRISPFLHLSIWLPVPVHFLIRKSKKIRRWRRRTSLNLRGRQCGSLAGLSLQAPEKIDVLRFLSSDEQQESTVGHEQYGHLDDEPREWSESRGELAGAERDDGCCRARREWLQRRGQDVCCRQHCPAHGPRDRWHTPQRHHE